jgi:hypothetical protein
MKEDEKKNGKNRYATARLNSETSCVVASPFYRQSATASGIETEPLTPS